MSGPARPTRETDSTTFYALASVRTAVATYHPHLVNFLIAVGLALLARGAGVLDLAGTGLALILALVILYTGGPVWLLVLITFVALGYLVTKLFWEKKRHLGVTEGKTGERGWRNVASNGGVPALVAAMTLIPDLSHSVVALGFVTAIATASADTFASELGVLSSRVYLLTKPWIRVPAGTNGGVSNWGHFVALVGAATAALTGVVFQIIPWADAWIPIAAGWIGCQIDSVLGALFEEGRGRAYGFMTKSDVNFLSIALAAFGVLLLLSA